MDWLSLAVFAEIADGNSLAQAARQLQIAPMSATRRLSALEKDLGVRLVHRTTRALALTAEGQSFLPHARALLAEKVAAYESVRPAADSACGLLRITASVAFGRKVVAPIVVGFMQDNPAIKVDLLLTDNLVDIVTEGLDMAVRIANLADSSLVARRLAASPRVLLASPEYLKRSGTPRTLSDLLKHECLSISKTTYWSFTTADGVIRAKVDGRFSANSIEGLLQACVGGLGIANLSSWFVKDAIEDGSLIEIPLADAEPEELAIWAVYPTNLMMPAKVRLFVDALAQQLRGWDAPLPRPRLVGLSA